MKGTTRSMMVEIRLRPPAMVMKQGDPQHDGGDHGINAEGLFQGAGDGLRLDAAGPGPRRKQATDSTTAPFFQPRAFFMTKERSHMYSSWTRCTSPGTAGPG